MRIVVDTNILFSFFWKNSLTKKLLVSPQFSPLSPEFALKEIGKYQSEMMQKAKIDSKEFSQLLSELKKVVEFVSHNEYTRFIKEAKRISPDKGDIDFIALSLKERCFLWSNDSVLKSQDIVRVFSTEEIIKILFG